MEEATQGDVYYRHWSDYITSQTIAAGSVVQIHEVNVITFQNERGTKTGIDNMDDLQTHKLRLWVL